MRKKRSDDVAITTEATSLSDLLAVTGISSASPASRSSNPATSLVAPGGPLAMIAPTATQYTPAWSRDGVTAQELQHARQRLHREDEGQQHQRDRRRLSCRNPAELQPASTKVPPDSPTNPKDRGLPPGRTTMRE